MVTRLINKIVYPIHAKYMQHCDAIEVHKRLVTFNNDPHAL